MIPIWGGILHDRNWLPLGRWRRALIVCLVLAPVMGAAQDAPDALTENYRDWVLICQNSANAETVQTGRLCEITQELRQAESGQRVLRITLTQSSDPSEDGVTLTLITPLGVRLADGVSLTLAEDDVAGAAFQTCLPAGCIATATLSPGIMERLARGGTATIGMFSTSGDRAQFEISLQGLSAAWRRLTALVQE